ncbi:MAG: serine/threonine protein kinase [Actinomycetota bacterium]
MEMPRVGTDFAGYQVQGIIGRGGMSVVYQAEHPRLARVVALKVLSVELSEDDRFRERFVRESRLAASLDHPNIIPIYDAGASDGLLFIAMRFVKGDLKSMIQREGRLRPERLMPVFTQIASALDAAHHLGLVHRDVKPANVLIAFSSGPDGRDHVYLADFGLTKHATSRSGITGTGQFVGTVDYMAPEQIEGKQVDSRVDVYALGCIAYECLTGRVPFTRDTDAAVIWAHLKEDPPKVSSVAGNVPPEVDEVIAKAMAKSVDDRYDSCMKLLSGLREVIDFDPARSQKGSLAPPPRRETVLRERPGEAADSSPVPPGVYPPAASSAAASFASPPQTGPQEAPQEVAEPSRYEGRSEFSPPTEEPAPPQPGPAAPPPAVVERAERPAASPGRDKRRGRLLGLVALIALLLAGGGAFAYLQGDGAGSGGGSGQASGAAVTEEALVARTTTDLEPVGPFPDAVESLFVVAHVGPENIVKWDCQRDFSLEDAIRGVACTPGKGVSEVSYSLFHDGLRMRSYFKELWGDKVASGAGECTNDAPWHGSWSIGPEVWAHSLGSNKGGYKGQILCYTAPTGEPHISWIDYATKIFADASAPPGQEGEDDLYYWWRQEAGPGHPTHIHGLESGNTSAIEGQNVVSGTIVAIGSDAVGNVTSATVKGDNGKETKVLFDPSRNYDCGLSHVQEHKVGRTHLDLPVEDVDGQLVVTYFTHC